MKASDGIGQLLRPNIVALDPYRCARNEFTGVADVYLDANENWHDFVGDEGRNRYPDPLSTQVREAVQAALGLEASNLVIGNGSDEIIDLLMRMFCIPSKDSVVLMPPTYGAYRVFADINDVKVENCPLTVDFQMDLEGLRDLLASEQPYGGRRKLLFICSPNNPTGNAFALDQIETVCSMFDGITVVDEAYFDYSPYESAATLVSRYPNLVVMRTLSKSWALANARVGIAYASDAIIQTMVNVKYPYNLGGPSQEMAVRALAQSEAVRDEAQATKVARDRLSEDLLKLGMVRKVFPSDANFLLVRVEDADDLYQWLQSQGVIVRNRSRELHCEQCLRITVGSEAENARLLDAMSRFSIV